MSIKESKHGVVLGIIAVALLLIGAAGSVDAGQSTVTEVVITDENRVQLALHTICEAISSGDAMIMDQFAGLVAEKNRSESAIELQNLHERFSSLRDATQPLVFDRPEFRIEYMEGSPADLTVTTELRFFVDGRPVAMPVTVKAVLVRTVITVTNMPEILSAISSSIDDSEVMATKLQSSTYHMNRPRPDTKSRTTYSPNLLKPTNIWGSHARFNSTVSRAEFDDADIFSRPSGVFSMSWKDSQGFGDREFTLTADANWDRIICVSKDLDEDNDWLQAFGSHGDGNYNFACPVAIDYLPERLLIGVADSYNNRAVAYNMYGWTNGDFVYDYEMSGNFGHIVDIAAGWIPGDPVYAKFAILDQGNCQVHIFKYYGVYESSYLQLGIGLNGLRNPTSICFHTNPNTGYSMPYVYVADAGNKRVVLKGLNAPYSFYSTQGYVDFPSDAYLSSIDIDYYGYVYVLDSYNGIVYKIDGSLTEVVATYGGIGSSDGELQYPNRLKMAQGFYDPGSPHDLETTDLGDMLITEQWGTQTGIRRFVLGSDVLTSDAYYIPKTLHADTNDYVRCDWYHTGASEVWCEVLHELQGWPGEWETVYTEHRELSLPGNQHCQFQLRPQDNDGIYKFDITIKSRYWPTATGFTETVGVQRYVDSTCIPNFWDGDKPENAGYLVHSSRSSGALDVCAHYNDDDRWYWIEATIQGGCDVSTVFTRWLGGAGTVNFYADSTDTIGYADLFTLGNRAYFKLDNPPPWQHVSGEDKFLGTAMVMASWDTSGGYNNWSDTVEMEWPVYSNYCHTACTTCGSILPGCPMLYSWNGQEYVLANNLLPQSESMATATGDVTDHILMKDGFALGNDGLYHLRISEDENERSWFDNIELSTVDVPTGTEVMLGPEGRIIAGHDLVEIQPLSATTATGEDVTELLRYDDEAVYTCDGPGFVELEYLVEDDGDEPTFVLMGPRPPDKPIPKLVEDDTGQPSILRLLARDEIGEYRLVDEIYPRKEAISNCTELSDYVVDDKLQLRLEWNDDIWLNHLPYLQCTAVEVVPKAASLVGAVHNHDGNVSELLTTQDDDRVTLKPGQQIELTFEAPPERANLTRYLVLRAVGRYEAFANGENTQPPSVPGGFEFAQNYPNPFNPRTTFSFGLPEASHVTLEIFNILGQKVVTLIDQQQPAGRHVYEWDGLTDGGQEVSSGVYLARLTAGTFTSTKKMVVTR
jgi:hypothetical protein